MYIHSHIISAEGDCCLQEDDANFKGPRMREFHCSASKELDFEVLDSARRYLLFNYTIY